METRLSDSYGEGFGKRLNGQTSSFVSRALPRSLLAVTELRYDHPQFILSTPPAEEDAFMVAVHLRHYERYEFWEDGKAAPVSTLHPGESIVYDLRRRPTFHLNSPFHSLHFYLPRLALNAIADDAEAARIEALRYKPGANHDDPVLRAMAGGILPLLQRPQDLSRIFMDHMMLAVGNHIAVTYGGMVPLGRAMLGGLTPRQQRRAMELLALDLSGSIPLSEIARECNLSTSHFSRAFRKSVGTSPYQWLIQQRVLRAKTLLREGKMTLAEIAVACGYSDQSHFTRSFSAQIGITPGEWRRIVRS